MLKREIIAYGILRRGSELCCKTVLSPSDKKPELKWRRVKTEVQFGNDKVEHKVKKKKSTSNVK